MIKKGIVENLFDVALGKSPPSIAIENVSVFNSFSGEFIEDQLILIKDDRFAYVGEYFDYPKAKDTEIIDYHGYTAIPGLIDSHTHIMFRSGLREFIRHVIPTGVTTVITETMELAFISGTEGIRYFVKPFKDQPINMFYTVPPLCGLTEEEERKAGNAQELREFLKDPYCLGMGEAYWGNLFAGGTQSKRIKDLADLVHIFNKRVEGHTAGAKGQKLQAYTLLGVSSCHEPITEKEVIERLRLGYWVMIRDGAIRRELEGVADIFKNDIDLRRLILTTDGVDPQGFMEEGYLDFALKRLISFGVPLNIAYKMVTLNPAEHFHLDDLFGAIAPFRMADLVLIPSPRDYDPTLVICRGKKIYEDGEVLVEPIEAQYPEYMFHSVDLKDIEEIPDRPSGRVRVMEQITRLVTTEGFYDSDDKDLNMILAIDRIGGKGRFLGFVKDYGLQRGACGSTMCWDTCDCIVVGADKISMITVLRRLKEIQGGAVFAIGENVVSEFKAEVCGVISLKPMEEIYQSIKALEDTLRVNGVLWERPLLTIDVMGTAAIPHLRITHRGYVRMRDRKLLGLY